jgi:hypothetical protein
MAYYIFHKDYGKKMVTYKEGVHFGMKKSRSLFSLFHR